MFNPSNRLTLLEDERIIIEEPIHWKNYISPFLWMGLAAILLVLRACNEQVNVVNIIVRRPLIYGYWHQFIVTFEEILLIVIIFHYMKQIAEIYYTRYFITNLRIVAVTGIINIYFQEMLIRKCEMVYVNQTAYEKVYNCGDVLCVSAGSRILLEDVHDVINFKQTLMSILSRNDD